LISRGNITARATRQAPTPPAALGLVSQHGNSLVCKKDAEHVQMVWRTSSIRYSPAATLDVHVYGSGVRILNRPGALP
jgi:hypothetical protein